MIDIIDLEQIETKEQRTKTLLNYILQDFNTKENGYKQAQDIFYPGNLIIDYFFVKNTSGNINLHFFPICIDEDFNCHFLVKKRKENIILDIKQLIKVNKKYSDDELNNIIDIKEYNILILKYNNLFLQNQCLFTKNEYDENELLHIFKRAEIIDDNKFNEIIKLNQVKGILYKGNNLSNLTQLNLSSISLIDIKQNILLNLKTVFLKGDCHIKNSFLEGLPNLSVFNCQETNISSLVEKSFDSCYQLTEVLLDPGIKYIGSGCFRNCYQLSQINLQDTEISSIEDFTFECCSSLISIKLPSNLQNLDQMAFFKCYNLSCFDFSELNAIKLSSILFFNSPIDFVLKVNSNHIEKWNQLNDFNCWSGEHISSHYYLV